MDIKILIYIKFNFLKNASKKINLYMLKKFDFNI